MISTLPAATSPKFCFTLDTEPDDLWQYRSENRFEHFSRLPRFHDLIAGRGARLTYLTTSEVAEDRTARQVMSKILDTRSAELGAHFHTWTRVWPFRTSELRNPPVQACFHHLGQKLEEQMLEVPVGAALSPIWPRSPATASATGSAGARTESSDAPMVTSG